MKKYNIVFSLGSDCACATYMKNSFLRTLSGPFDWITGVDFQSRTTLILNSFEFFLNFQYLTIIPIKTDAPLADWENYNIKDTKSGFSFFHDFPVGQPLADSLPSVQEKYQRRITRFYKEIHEAENVLLIWFAHNWETPDALVLELCQKVCDKFAKNIDFLIIEHDENKALEEVERRVLAPNITRYSLYTRAVDEKGNPTTLGREDACLPIFKQYKRCISFKERMSTFAQNILHLGKRILSKLKKVLLRKTSCQKT